MLGAAPVSEMQRQLYAQRPAPMGGLDLSSPITMVPDGFAICLDDWVCRKDGLAVRAGYSIEASDLDPVVSLLPYPGQLFGATAAGIYAGSGLAHGGVNSGDWQSDVIANAGGVHLLAVNGADEARHYNGTAWSVSAITDVNSRDLFGLVNHQRRFFAAEKNSLNVWYLGINAYAGPASIFPVASQFKKGGSIVAIGSNGDQFMIATQKELAVYRGTNPDNSAAFGLVGVYKIPEPVGKRCFKDGAILTKKGLLPIGAIMEALDSGKAATSVSRNVDAGITGASHVIDSLSNDLMLIHDGSKQWIKSDTGGWSGFSGFDTATCWIEHDDGLYFGTSDGEVRKYGGDLDGEAPIRAFAVDGPSRFGTDYYKWFLRARPLYTARHPYRPRIEMLTDLNNIPDSFDAANIDDAYWEWSDITWETQPKHWIREKSARVPLWHGVCGDGVYGSLMMSIQTRTPIIWTGYDLAFSRRAMH